MLGRLRSRLTYANVASSRALFIALGTGGAYAADTIGSSDIINESILSQDIKNGEVKSTEIAGSAVSNSKLAPNVVGTGKVLNETLLAEDVGPDSVGASELAGDALDGSNIFDGGIAGVDLATDAVDGSKILDGAVANADLADGSVGPNKIQDGSITSAKVLDDNQVGGGLGPSDLATNAVAQAEIATDGVAATEIQNDSIDSGEIVDFGLTNQDVSVLFAEVSALGTLDNHSGGVTVTKIGAAGTGQYDVDFGRNIALCTAVATIGPAAAGSPVAGEVYVADRSGDANAVFVDTNTSAGAAADRAFRLVLVC